MAGKKPNNKGKSDRSPDSGNGGPKPHDPPNPSDPFGPLGAESLLRRLLASNGKRQASPLGLAEELVEMAWQSQRPQERIDLARQALTVSADCADAYLLLAHQAHSHDEARQLLEAGVAAGARAIGPDRFARSTGHFWVDNKTRPYMRARLRLAQCLWECGLRHEAIGHYADMLRLNPNDNQGVRYLLLSALVDTDSDTEALLLLSEYDGEESAEWSYTSALLSFRRGGDCEESRRLLQKALRVNKHVPFYLVGAKGLPAEAPRYITMGEESEAASYVGQFLRNWRSSEGAIPWVRKTLKVSLPRPPKPRKPKWPQFRQAFLRLPQVEDEVWQLEVCRLPIAPPQGTDATVEKKADALPEAPCDTADAKAGEKKAKSKKKKPNLPWALILWSGADETILSFEVGHSQPTMSDVWDMLLESLLRPRIGDPHRPRAIEVRRKTYWKSWHTKLKEIEIDCRLAEELEGFEQVIESFVPAASNVRRMLEGDGAVELNSEALAALPQEFGEVWQVDARRLPGWLEQEGELCRPWATLVTSRDEHMVLYQNLGGDEPALDVIARGVLEAIAQPLAGEPHRPATIEVVRDDLRDRLYDELQAIDVACVSLPRLRQIDEVFRDVARFLSGGKAPPALVEVPGIHLEQVGSFYDAAAQFYRHSPWRKLPGDTVIKVVCNKYQSNTWYAIVMGQSGMVLGLALYQDLDMLRALFSGENEDEVAHTSSGLSIMYGEAFEIPTADLDASEQYDWPVASAEAYPNPVYVNPGRSMRPPLGWELELLEGALRAIPQFLDNRQAAAEFAVPIASGELKLQLSRQAD